MRKLLKITAVVVLLAVVIGAAENNLFGYVSRTAQLHMQSVQDPYDAGFSPAAVLLAGQQPATDKMTILAVADIADCEAEDYFSKNFSTLQSWAGLTPKIDPATVGAVKARALVEYWPNAPILAVGDLVYRRGTPNEFADCFEPIWGGLRNRFLPAPGNHEYFTPGAFAYYDYWANQAGPDRRGYYFVRRGNWLLLSLNSEIDSGPASAQALWLSDILAAASETCILAFYHRPAYSLQSRDKNENAEFLFKQLQSAGATLVLNGHNHFYERTFPLNGLGQVQEDTGTVSFVVGTGGRSASREREYRDTTANAVFGQLGVLRLELGDNAFSWWFHGAGTKEVLDQGSRTCNAPRTIASL